MRIFLFRFGFGIACRAIMFVVATDATISCPPGVNVIKLFSFGTNDKA
jgi:hypothetical protein